MKCFEVMINGEKVCTAGVGEDGVLTSIVTFLKHSNAADGTESLDLTVAGLTNRESGEREELEWSRKNLAVGDEILIRIIEASTCDEPKHIEVGYLECSFCGKKQAEVAKLIAGPGVYICDVCVGTCSDGLVTEGPTGSITIIDMAAEERCSFCGKKPIEVVRIVGVPTARICNDCLRICGEILAEDVY